MLIKRSFKYPDSIHMVVVCQAVMMWREKNSVAPYDVGQV